MQSQNRLFDDLVKMMNGAAGTFAGMTREAQEGMRERMREFVGGMDFVSRDEVDALRARLDLLERPAAPSGEVKPPPAGVTGIETPEE